MIKLLGTCFFFRARTANLWTCLLSYHGVLAPQSKLASAYIYCVRLVSESAFEFWETIGMAILKLQLHGHKDWPLQQGLFMFVGNIVCLGFKVPTASQQGSVRLSGTHNQAICGKCQRGKREGNEARVQADLGCFPIYLATFTFPNYFSP